MRSASLLLLAVLVLSTAGCTSDNPVNTDIGTVRVYVTDPSLGPQTIKDSQRPVQVADWEIEQATLLLADTSIDLLAEDACHVIDRVPTATSISAPPTFEGKCSTGIIMASGEEPQSASLQVRFTMEHRRAEPVDLSPGADYDGDGVANESDSCPLIANEDQVNCPDNALPGTVCACAFIATTGAFVTDSDSDGVSDGFDNCVHTPNPPEDCDDNAFTAPVQCDSNNDGIGDACATQVAAVDDGVAAELLLGPVDYVQQTNRATFFVLDFSGEDVLDCDWSGCAPGGLPGESYPCGRCTLNSDALQFCVQNDPISAQLGCPN